MHEQLRRGQRQKRLGVTWQMKRKQAKLISILGTNKRKDKKPRERRAQRLAMSDATERRWCMYTFRTCRHGLASSPMWRVCMQDNVCDGSWRASRVAGGLTIDLNSGLGLLFFRVLLVCLEECQCTLITVPWRSRGRPESHVAVPCILHSCTHKNRREDRERNWATSGYHNEAVLEWLEINGEWEARTMEAKESGRGKWSFQI